METKQLLFFKRTAELEHMTKAANELMVSEPSLSKIISELEKELGVRLFDHVGRRIVLNPCGKTFYQRVVSIFSELEDAKKEVRNINLSQQTRLTIVTNVSQYMPSLLKLIMEGNPEMKIRQLSAPRRDIINMLLNGEVDFAVCSPPIKENVEMKTVQLRFEPGVVIFPEGHWLKNRAEITLEEITGETFITAAKGYGAREAFDAYFEQLGFFPPILIETGDTGSVFRYVESGLGIAAVSMSAVLQEPSFRHSYSVIRAETPGCDVALTWRANQYISGAGRFFIEKSQEYFRGLEEFVEKNRIR